VEVRETVPVYITFLKQRQKILIQAGPWRSSGDWWTDTPWRHDEWDITVARKTIPSRKAARFEIVSSQETAVYRIYQDLRTLEWFVEGVYD
jgi:protein ImuB